ncbi:hypothetical protein [Pseudarthrobacter sp. DSP2-3-2b1]|uniref:hypothetical protein n=1 Tax=Pseudarthrobacter sp. DSP2-3-2b1 TaxID=2804661 RepID=UPI003CF3EC79
MADMMNDDDGSATDDADDREAPAAETMIISRWHEPGHPQGFRARITYGRTPGAGPRTVSTADPDEVLRVVQEWLASGPGPADR